MRRSGLTSLVVFVVITLSLFAGVLAAGWRPLLGLDLQGGVAVVLRPTTDADESQLDEAISIIRNRVDAIGVAEPDISRQGGNIVVQLPGVKDRERALELVGTTAELRFRPVLNAFTPPATGADTTDPTSDPTTGTGSTAPGTDPTGSTEAPAATSTTGAPATTPTTVTTTGTGEQGLAPVGAGGGEVAFGATTTAPITTVPGTAPITTVPGTAPGATAPTSGPATTAPGDATAPAPPGTEPSPTTAPTGTVPTPLSGVPEITPREADTKDAVVVLPQIDRTTGQETARYQLGPTLVTGDALVAADTQANLVQSQWLVQLKFKDGEQNVGAWRTAAQACFQASNPTVCPTGALAAVLDGEVISAPQVNDTFASTNDAVITGSFTEREARDLAQKLRYGALPVTFERQQSQDVSATVGRDALRAGVAAGLIGLVVVALYIFAYYRLLGLVAMASLAMSFALLWTIISWLGETQGLALSLSGVVGIIVAIGISIDSNIVYFEQIKDDCRTGRNLRSAAQRAFSGAMSTIIKADLVSLIGAALLYWLTVGPVKGFALYLGLSTILDLVASYFFMRPAVAWLFHSGSAGRHPRRYGMPPTPAPVSPGAPAAASAGVSS